MEGYFLSYIKSQRKRESTLRVENCCCSFSPRLKIQRNLLLLFPRFNHLNIQVISTVSGQTRVWFQPTWKLGKTFVSFRSEPQLQWHVLTINQDSILQIHIVTTNRSTDYTTTNRHTRRHQESCWNTISWNTVSRVSD